MKIRNDFVTNSSSSSYVLSFNDEEINVFLDSIHRNRFDVYVNKNKDKIISQSDYINYIYNMFYDAEPYELEDYSEFVCFLDSLKMNYAQIKLFLLMQREIFIDCYDISLFFDNKLFKKIKNEVNGGNSIVFIPYCEYQEEIREHTKDSNIILVEGH